MHSASKEVSDESKTVDDDGRYRGSDDYRRGSKWFTPRNRQRVLDALERIRPIAEAHDATFGQIAIAWTVTQPGVTAAIVGARTPEQARENARAGDIELSPAELQQVRTVFEELGGPED